MKRRLDRVVRCCCLLSLSGFLPSCSGDDSAIVGTGSSGDSGIHDAKTSDSTEGAANDAAVSLADGPTGPVDGSVLTSEGGTEADGNAAREADAGGSDGALHDADGSHQRDGTALPDVAFDSEFSDAALSDEAPTPQATFADAASNDSFADAEVVEPGAGTDADPAAADADPAAVTDATAGPDADAHAEAGAAMACTARLARAYGDTSSQKAADVAMDSSGNLIVVGTFQGTLSELGETPYLRNVDSYGQDDAFVAKVAPDGVVLWRTAFADVDGNSQYATSVAVLPGGDVLVAGTFQVAITLGTTTLTAPGGFYGSDAFAVRLAGSDGQVVAVHQIGGAGAQWATEIRATPMLPDYPNAFTVMGYFDTEIDCSDGTSTKTCASQGGDDVFVADVFDSTKRAVWVYGGPGDQRVMAASVDAEGRLALAGEYSGTLAFGGSTAPLISSADDASSEFNAFAARLDLPTTPLTAPTPVFAVGFPSGGCASPGQGVASAVAIDPTDPNHDVWVGGEFSGCIDILGRDDSLGATDGFVTKLAGDTGAPRWRVLLANSTQQHVSDLAVDGAGAAVVVGSTRGAVTFDGFGALPPVGGEDLFVAMLGPTGRFRYARRIGGASSTYVTSPNVALRAEAGGSSLALSATFRGQIDLDGTKVGQAALSPDALLTQLSCLETSSRGDD